MLGDAAGKITTTYEPIVIEADVINNIFKQ